MDVTVCRETERRMKWSFWQSTTSDVIVSIMLHLRLSVRLSVCLYAAACGCECDSCSTTIAYSAVIAIFPNHYASRAVQSRLAAAPAVNMTVGRQWCGRRGCDCRGWWGAFTAAGWWRAIVQPRDTGTTTTPLRRSTVACESSVSRPRLNFTFTLFYRRSLSAYNRERPLGLCSTLHSRRLWTDLLEILPHGVNLLAVQSAYP